MSLVVSHLSVNLNCSYEHAMRVSCKWTQLGRPLPWIYGIMSYGSAINYTKLFENCLLQGIFWRIILVLSLSSWKIEGSHKNINEIMWYTVRLLLSSKYFIYGLMIAAFDWNMQLMDNTPSSWAVSCVCFAYGTKSTAERIGLTLLEV